MSSEIIPKENLVYKIKDSSYEPDSLDSAAGYLLRFREDKIYTLDQLNNLVKEKITMYQKDLTELPWDKVRWEPSQQLCACFGCRLSRLVSGWFRGRK